MTSHDGQRTCSLPAPLPAAIALAEARQMHTPAAWPMQGHSQPRVHVRHQPPAAACASECDVLVMTPAAYQIMTSIASVTHPLSHRHSQQCSCCECDCGNGVKPETNPSGGGQVSVPVTSQPSHHKPYHVNWHLHPAVWSCHPTIPLWSQSYMLQ